MYEKIFIAFDSLKNVIWNTLENAWYFIVQNRKFVYLGLILTIVIPLFIKWMET